VKTLVVDDEAVSRKMLERIMRSFGDCMAVNSGAEAIVAFEAAWHNWAPFDLVTLDVSMPDMLGIDVLKRIRHLEDTKQVPPEKRVKIIMVTAHSDKDTVIAAIQAGCNDYLTKPFHQASIAKKLLKLWTPWSDPVVRTAGV